MDSRLWWNGEVVPGAEAKMHVTAESAMRGINAFEGLRAYWQPDHQRFAIVSLGAHLDRLRRSLKLLHLPAAHLVDSLAEGVRELLALAEPGRDYYLRPTVYLEEGSYTASASLCRFGSFISCRDVPPAEAPLACHISSYTRVAASAFPPRAKSGATYAMFRLARIEATAHGCDEAILLDADQRVTESGGAAIFTVSNGRVATPDLSHAILDGITRRHAIQILEKRLDQPVAQRAISAEELLRAGEVFLAGTLDEIRPVISISGGRKRLEQDVGAAARAEYVGVCRGRRSPLGETMLEYVSPRVPV